MISPPTMTRMRVAFLTVDSLCAITNEVLPNVTESMAFWILFSVLVSTELVASSNMTMGASLTIALAMAICCLWPTDRAHLPSNTVSYPFSSVRM